MGDTPALRFVVAGTGAMARYHVRRFSRFAGVQFLGCYDRSPERADSFSREMGIPHSASELDRLLRPGSVDAVCAAVADPEHHPVLVAAVDRGIPVFMEKPFTRTIEEAEEIVLRQAERRVPITVNFSKMNYPAICGLVHAANYGTAGAAKQLELSYLQSWLVSTVWGEWWRNPRWLWRISSSHGGGGALRDLGSHLVYLALRIGGAITSCEVSSSLEAKRTAAEGSGFSCDMNDTFVIRLGHESGLQTTIRGSYAAAGHINTVRARLVGERRILSVDTGVDNNTIRSRDRGPGSEVEGYYSFRKVYSTYHAFVEGLRRSLRWDGFSPSATSGLAVQRVIGGCEV